MKDKKTNNEILEKENIKKEKKMSKEYPFILLMRILTLFNYEEGYLKDINGETITSNQLADYLKIDRDYFNNSIKILEEYNLIQVLEVMGNKKIFISDKIIETIKKARTERKNYKKIREINIK